MIVAKFFKQNSDEINYLFTNDNNIYSGISITNNGFEKLDVSLLKEIINFFKISNDSKKLFNYKGFEVYIDNKTKFKHFFKDGQENFDLFFEYNGQDAILYDGKSKKNSKLKRFFLYGAIILISPFFLKELFWSIKTKAENNFFYNRYINQATYISPDESHIAQYNYNFNIDIDENIVDKIINKINASNITEEEKKLLTNKDLLNNIIKYYDKTAIYDLFSFKLNKLTIQNINYSNESLEGSYLIRTPNILYINKNTENRNHIITHEYIHLLQNSNNKYTYLLEATAERFALESNNIFIDNTHIYYESVQTLKLLIDIIGPEPILKSVFGRNDTMLEQILEQNLEKNDYFKLIEFLKERPEDIVMEEIKIREILKQLYKNIYNQDISKDPNIMYDITFEKDTSIIEDIISLDTTNTMSNTLFNNEKKFLVEKYYLRSDKFNENPQVSFRYLIGCDSIIKKLIDYGHIGLSIYKQISIDEYNSLKDKSKATLMYSNFGKPKKAKIENGMIVQSVYGNTINISIEDAINKYGYFYCLEDVVQDSKIPEGWKKYYETENLFRYNNCKLNPINNNCTINGYDIIIKTPSFAEQFKIFDVNYKTYEQKSK